MRTTAIEQIGIVIPAHDEEAAIDRCLDGLAVAARHPALRGIEVRLTVVLDACEDRTGERVARRGAADVVEVAGRRVGAARAAGFAHLLQRSGVAAERHWLATTDADTLVPPDWLARQLAWHRRGRDAVAGTVTVHDWSEQPRRVRLRFEDHQWAHGLGLDHRHVHGANLGMTGAVYRAAGGVPDLDLGEDHALWEALGRTGATRVSAPDLPVVTSARRDGRAAGGFSDLLRSL